MLVLVSLSLFGLRSYLHSRALLLESYHASIQATRERLEVNLAGPMWRLDKETLDFNLQAEIKPPVVGISIREEAGGPIFASASADEPAGDPALEDRLDNEAAAVALQEPGASMPWEQVKRDLGLVE